MSKLELNVNKIKITFNETKKKIENAAHQLNPDLMMLNSLKKNSGRPPLYGSSEQLLKRNLPNKKVSKAGELKSLLPILSPKDTENEDTGRDDLRSLEQNLQELKDIPSKTNLISLVIPSRNTILPLSKSQEFENTFEPEKRMLSKSNSHRILNTKAFQKNYSSAHYFSKEHLASLLAVFEELQ